MNDRPFLLPTPAGIQCRSRLGQQSTGSLIELLRNAAQEKYLTQTQNLERLDSDDGAREFLLADAGTLAGAAFGKRRISMPRSNNCCRNSCRTWAWKQGPGLPIRKASSIQPRLPCMKLPRAVGVFPSAGSGQPAPAPPQRSLTVPGCPVKRLALTQCNGYSQLGILAAHIEVANASSWPSPTCFQPTTTGRTVVHLHRRFAVQQSRLIPHPQSQHHACRYAQVRSQ